MTVTLAMSAQTTKNVTDRSKGALSYPIPKIRLIKQGFTMTLWMDNAGGFEYARLQGLYEQPPLLEYPAGSGIEHLYSAGLLIGAVVTDSTDSQPVREYASVTSTYGLSGETETTPEDTSIWVTSSDSLNGHNQRAFDDDVDGRVDEDELDGVDNDRDGSIDEDYGAVSEHDIYFGYTDTSLATFPGRHRPLGIRVWQRSYSWKRLVNRPILPIEYTIVNIGRNVLHDVFVGFQCEFDVGGPTHLTYNHNYAGFVRSERLAYVHNPTDAGSTPIGITLLSSSRAMDSLQFIFHWYLGSSPIGGAGDSVLYNSLSCAEPGIRCIDEDGSPTDLRDVNLLYSFGPFRRLGPGDTLQFTIAFVSGDYVFVPSNGLTENAADAREFTRRQYSLMPSPPSPPLDVVRTGNGYALDWHWRPGHPGLDPLETWDDFHEYVGGLPDTNWRRRNPPPGHFTGGRIFGGFALWRSVVQRAGDTTWSLVAKYHTDDYPDRPGGAGLQFSAIDSNLRAGRAYGYAVTSFSLPDAPNASHGDSVSSFRGSIESNIADNATFLHLSFGPSAAFGEVKVVPNPYRGDSYYTDGRGYEGAELTWTPEKRVLWFIHLPDRATIRIYSLVGEVITTIGHDDAARAAGGLPIGQEEWRLFSEGGRPIASGIYLFSVESKFGTQVGKFVIIL